jgi:hypothetical protein
VRTGVLCPRWWCCAPAEPRLTAVRGQATDKTSVPKEERGLIKTTEKADAMNWSGRTARGDTSALKWLKPPRVYLH